MEDALGITLMEKPQTLIVKKNIVQCGDEKLVKLVKVAPVVVCKTN